LRILVQKFGGTSLSTPQAREAAFRHIRRAADEGYALVVVVSAMGRRGDPYATDTLLALLSPFGPAAAARERDLLMSCGEIISAAVMACLLQSRGIPAAAFTGEQAGIATNGDYGNARIVRVAADRLKAHLEEGKVCVVAGFQGAANGEVTTLGRGGSDTTATALGAALGAECVDIFTDVDGVLTADPRLVRDARPLAQVSYAEICNMAYNGAKVIHPRAVEIAMEAGIPVRIRSTFAEGGGTLVADPSKLRAAGVKERLITAIAHSAEVAQIRVSAEGGPCDLQLRVFREMARAGISVDLISVNPSEVAYTVSDADADRAAERLRDIGCAPEVVRHCAKVSVIGGGMNGVPGVMAAIVEALSEEGIGILQSADSNTTIWVLVSSADTARAVNALHRKFRLHAPEGPDESS